MLHNKYFEIVKCTTAQAWKIRLWIIGSITVLTFLIINSPFKPLFRYMGYSNSNGCPFYTFTGIPCPTCGMGRGLTSIIHFDLAHIFYFNPSSIFLYLISFSIIMFVFIISFFNYKVKMKNAALKLWPHFIIFIVVIWIINIIWGHHDY